MTTKEAIEKIKKHNENVYEYLKLLSINHMRATKQGDEFLQERSANRMRGSLATLEMLGIIDHSGCCGAYVYLKMENEINREEKHGSE